ncbi:hypothetical protein ACWFQ8_33330 [Streptomyces sp. NPDC055254]
MPSTQPVISKMNFLFRQVRGTLMDSFDEELQEMHDYAVGYGLASSKGTVLFLDCDAPESGTGSRSAAFRSTRRAVVGVLVGPHDSVTFGDEAQVFAIQNANLDAFHLESPTSVDDRAQTRATCLRSMTQSGTPCVGMLEVIDTNTNVLTYAGLPGDRDGFLRAYNVGAL